MKLLIMALILLACSHPKKVKDGDRRLKQNEIPAFLNSYRDQKLDDLAFFEKTTNGVRTFEVKYDLEVNGEDQEVSLTYSEAGVLLEREQDLDFSDLPKPVRDKILKILADTYDGVKVHESELRTDKDQNKFIDIEIRHKSSPSGYWELSFDEEGNYVSREPEHYSNIETLN